MQRNSQSGCLFVLLRLLGLGPALPMPDDEGSADSVTDLPYRTRDDFLSAAERSFYGVLVAAIAGRALVFAKVNLADVLFVSGKEKRQSYHNRIDRKHVDFLLCTLDTVRPVAAIELDDKSHERADRVDRDAFVDAAFDAAGLPLVRFPAQRAYNVAEVARQLEPHLMTTTAPKPMPMVSSDVPSCGKCGVVMVLRQATKGENAGRQFYGCPNYPRCKEIVTVN